ncbi:MAG: UDP-4-amino-4,6-dideoxy-N-acetyl-beta-L-altrosamine transaminase [Campylobacterota bacterium]
MQYLPYSCQSINEEDIQAVTRAMRSSHLTQGGEVDAFENELCTYVGTKHAAVFNSATSALFALYKAYGLKEGDEVITTPLSFVATSNMLIECGCTPVFVDIQYNGNIDEKKIEQKITPKTKAIVSVDFGGNVVDVKTIRKLCSKHDLKFISDSSHALGSAVDGQKVGTFADATVFSFHAIKPITTFEGGAVVTDDNQLDAKLRLLRSHGIVKKKLWNSDMVSMGYNLRLSDVASALGRSQLKRLESFIAKRELIARFYDEKFANNPYFATIKIKENIQSARHLYPITLFRNLWCAKEDIFGKLQEMGIGVQVHYKPIHTNSFYEKIYGKQEFTVAQEFYKSQLSLPCHQGMDLDDAQRVVAAVFSVCERFSGGCRC